MAKYSIKDLEHLSGIKAHTIRIWEQRYNCFCPDRTSTNIRYYSDEDLKYILNIAFLKDRGFKISNIIKLSKAEINKEVLSHSEVEMPQKEQIHALTLAMINMDERKFDKVLSNSLLILGLEKAMLHVIYPFLHRIGILWQSGSINPCHEHFISNLVRQKLIVAIDGIDQGEGPKVLMFLPEGELHELGLLFAAYIFKTRGFQLVYFGQTVPYDDIILANQTLKPDMVFTIVTSYPEQDSAKKYILDLGKLFQEKPVFITGSLSKDDLSEKTSNVRFMANPEDLINVLETEFESFIIS